MSGVTTERILAELPANMRLRAGILVLVLVLALLPAMAHSAGPEAPELTSGQRQALSRGEVLLLDSSEQGAVGHLVAVILIEARIEGIFDAITACQRAVELHQPLRECEQLALDSSHQLVRHVVDSSWLTPKQEYLMRVDFQSPREFRFHQVSGDFKVFEGSWQLSANDAEDRWLARYEFRVQPGFPAPRWLWQRLLKKNVPEFMAVVRQLAEQGPLTDSAGN